SVRKLSHTLERWLPVATLTNGTLHLQTNVIKAPGLKWAGGDLEGRLELAVKNQAIALDASVVQSEAGYKIKFGSTNFDTSGETNWPVATLQVRAHGNTNAATIEQANVTSPALNFQLSEPLEISFSGPLLSKPARLNVAADLSRQPWFRAEGRIAGEAQLTPV